MIFAAMSLALLLAFRGLAVQDSEDVIFAEDHVVLTVEPHVRTGVLAEQHPVTDGYVERCHSAVVANLALAGRDHDAFLRLFLGRVGDDDPAGRLLFALRALDQDAVLEW